MYCTRSRGVIETDGMNRTLSFPFWEFRFETSSYWSANCEKNLVNLFQKLSKNIHRQTVQTIRKVLTTKKVQFLGAA